MTTISAKLPIKNLDSDIKTSIKKAREDKLPNILQKKDPTLNVRKFF